MAPHGLSLPLAGTTRPRSGGLTRRGIPASLTPTVMSSRRGFSGVVAVAVVAGGRLAKDFLAAGYEGEVASSALFPGWRFCSRGRIISVIADLTTADFALIVMTRWVGEIVVTAIVGSLSFAVNAPDSGGLFLSVRGNILVDFVFPVRGHFVVLAAATEFLAELAAAFAFLFGGGRARYACLLGEVGGCFVGVGVAVVAVAFVVDAAAAEFGALRGVG